MTTQTEVKIYGPLYDQGSSKALEDGYFVQPPYYGVLDGVSAPYSPNNPPLLFRGRTGGELVVRTVEDAFKTLDPTLAPAYIIKHLTEILENVLLKETLIAKATSAIEAAFAFKKPGEQVTQDMATQLLENMLARLRCGAESLPIYTADKLPGTTFALAKVTDEAVQIIQGGDCFAIWTLRDGSIHTTVNQVRAHDTDMMVLLNTYFNEIAVKRSVDPLTCSPEQRASIRGEQWDRFYGPLSKARISDTNQLESPRGYALLNSQRSVIGMVAHHNIPRSEIRELILISDGMIPWSVIESNDDQAIAEEVVHVFKEGGLESLLEAARAEEERRKHTHYTDYAEATGLALVF